MRRRGLVATLVTVGTAGCLREYAPSGPRNPPEADGDPPGAEGDDAPGLSVAEWDVLEGDDGSLVVEATVRNAADGERSGTVVAEASTPDRTETRETSVTVTAGDRTGVELVFEMDFETFVQDGQVRVAVE